MGVERAFKQTVWIAVNAFIPIVPEIESVSEEMYTDSNVSSRSSQNSGDL